MYGIRIEAEMHTQVSRTDRVSPNAKTAVIRP